MIQNRTKYSFKLNSVLVCICMLTALLNTSCRDKVRPKYEIKNGELDLTNWDFKRDGSVKLTGQWAFFWEKLYTPSDFANDSSLIPQEYINVPGVWNEKRINRKALPGMGYATYRLKVHLNPALQVLAIKAEDASSSYNMYLNEDLFLTCGKPSTNSHTAVHQYLTQIRAFGHAQNTLYITVQVSNYFHSRGGMWANITLGNPEKLVASKERSVAHSMLLAGIFAILFIIHLWIFLFRKKEVSALTFSMLVLLVLIRILVTDERILYQFFPNFNLNVGLRLEYLPLVLCPYLYLKFNTFLFKYDFSKKILRFMLIITVVESLLILLTPTFVYTNFLLPYFAFGMLIIGYTMVIILFRCVPRKRHGAMIHLIIILMALFASVNDYLYASGIIDSIYLIPTSISILVLAQAYILVSNISKAFSEVEVLSENLEKKVVERTLQLEEARGKSDRLLLDILPSEVAEELKETGKAAAKQFDEVTVMFTDFEGFTKIAEKLSPSELVDEIDTYFKNFDQITAKYGIEKIKTIGDSYMCVGGLPVTNTTHATDTVRAAVEIIQFVEQKKADYHDSGKLHFDVRIGIHTGSVIAGVVGSKKFAYDIWGDTVNIAARMEQNSAAGRINISRTTFELVKEQYNFTHRGKVMAKNKGEIEMYFMESGVLADPLTFRK